MSRIGKKPIKIPADVEVTENDGLIKVKKGQTELEYQLHSGITAEIKDGEIVLNRPDDNKESRALHGLMRSLVNNMITGVTEGFKKELEIQGIGYRAVKEGNVLNLTLGLSHPVEIPEPEGITFEVPKATQIIISGADKQQVGEVAAKIRRIRPPEPYKGKGIRYKGEFVKIKVGKTGAK